MSTSKYYYSYHPKLINNRPISYYHWIDNSQLIINIFDNIQINFRTSDELDYY